MASTEKWAAVAKNIRQTWQGIVRNVPVTKDVPKNLIMGKRLTKPLPDESPEDDGSGSIRDLAGEALARKLRSELGEVRQIETNLYEERQQQLAMIVTGEENQLIEIDLSYIGVPAEPFSDEIREKLAQPINQEDIEIKPDGTLYLPELKYRKILCKTFGPGGWAIMPHGDPSHYQSDTEGGTQLVAREYAMFCLGQLVARAVGDHARHSRFNMGRSKAMELAKSDALVRCCRELGIARELTDPQFVATWKSKFALEVWCENVRSKERRRLWRKKTSKEIFPYPWIWVRA